MSVREVVIVGGGPAGLTAAIYAARANLSPVVIEGEQVSSTDGPGGQLMITTEVENYPGFVDGIMGPDLMRTMRAQAERFGAEFVTRRVVSVDFSGSPFEVRTSNDEVFVGRTVIVSTGAKALMLGLESEQRLLGYGVSTCATCDGFFFRGHDIAVVGGGDSAVEEAVFLTKYADSVTIVHRRDRLRASAIMAERAFSNPKIKFAWNKSVTQVFGDEEVSGVQLTDNETGEVSSLDVTGVFVAIGHVPSTELFQGQLKLNSEGYILTEGGSRTNVDGVFACGDVQDFTYRQAITAAGSGCMAAIDAERWLEAHPH